MEILKKLFGRRVLTKLRRDWNKQPILAGNSVFYCS